jgi:hypothetical protein
MVDKLFSIASLKTYSKNSKHLIKIFELISAFYSNFSQKNLFIAFYLASTEKSLSSMHIYI